MKRWHERCALATGGDIRAAKIADRGDPRSGGDDVGIADLQGIRPGTARLVPDRLAVAADGADFADRNVAPLDEGAGRIAETFADLAIEAADVIDWLIDRGAGRLLQGKSQCLSVGLAVCGNDLDAGVAETHERGIDAVHAGAGHQADVVVGH